MHETSASHCTYGLARLLCVGFGQLFPGRFAILRLLERRVQVLSHSHCPIGLVFGVSWIST